MALRSLKSNPAVSTSSRSLVEQAMAYPGILFGVGSTNSVEERGQRERVLGALAP